MIARLFELVRDTLLVLLHKIIVSGRNADSSSSGPANAELGS